jgi:enoyl-CoA hydratase
VCTIVEYVSLTEQQGGVVVMTASRPPANAMDIGLLTDIVTAVELLASAPPRAVVLSGVAGVFSAGADLKLVPTYGPQEQRLMVDAINAMALGVYGLRCPVVGAITGHAIAGGLVLALCTDIRVASDAGRYGLTEVKVGVAYPQAAIGVVAAELAPNAARRLALGNQLIDAAECLRLGVFDEVTAVESVLPRAIEIATELAVFPPAVYARTKHELRGATLERLRRAAAEDPLLAQWV